MEGGLKGSLSGPSLTFLLLLPVSSLTRSGCLEYLTRIHDMHSVSRVSSYSRLYVLTWKGRRDCKGMLSLII